jgi:hypothetical protein
LAVLFVCPSPKPNIFREKRRDQRPHPGLFQRQQEPVYFSPKVEEYFQQLQLGGEAGLSKNLTLRQSNMASEHPL